MSKLNPILVPNVEQVAREMTDSSQISIILKRVLQLQLIDIIRFGLNNLLYAKHILQKDFAAGIKVLCELEILNLSKSGKRHFVLHNQMVDMAVALKNKRIISYFLGLAKTYGFQAGLATYNPTKLLQCLADIPNLPSDVIIYAPIHQNPILEKYTQTSPLLWKELPQ